jgi:hypothetical protein
VYGIYSGTSSGDKNSAHHNKRTHINNIMLYFVIIMVAGFMNPKITFVPQNPKIRNNLAHKY